MQFAGQNGGTATGTVESVYVDEQGDIRLKLSDNRDIGMREVLGISQPTVV